MMAIDTASTCNLIEEKFRRSGADGIGIFTRRRCRFLRNDTALCRGLRDEHNTKSGSQAFLFCVILIIIVVVVEIASRRFGALNDICDDKDIWKEVQECAFGRDGRTLRKIRRDICSERDTSDSGDESQLEQFDGLQLSARRDGENEAARILSAVTDDSEVTFDAEGVGDARCDRSQCVGAEIMLAMRRPNECDRRGAARKR